MAGWRTKADRCARVAWLGAALVWLAAASQATPQQLHELEQARLSALARAQEEAVRQQAAEVEAKRLAVARVASAASLRALEQSTAEASTTMDALARRRADAASRLEARAKQLTPLLPLLERLSLYPAETLIVVPGRPDQSLNGLLVLRGLTRQLGAEAEALRAEQAELARLTQGMAQQERRLTEAQAAQAAQAAGLDRQIADAQSRSRAAEDAAAVAARRAAEQAGQAETLRAALSQLEVSRKQDESRARADTVVARHAPEPAGAEARQRQVAITQPAGPGLGEAQGQLGTPVAGNVVKAFGEAGVAGPATGISFGAPPAARVSAPCGGRTVFAGPFRSFGQLMIIDCGGGFHFVLAGLDRLDVAVGRLVQPGEPVGVMAAWEPRTLGTRPLLYVELRERGQPINPAPYLRNRP